MNEQHFKDRLDAHLIDYEHIKAQYKKADDKDKDELLAEMERIQLEIQPIKKHFGW